MSRSRQAASLLTRLGQRQFSSGSRASALEFSTSRAGEPTPAIVDTFKKDQGVLEVPARLLMGPGPANGHPRVLAAQALPLLGHMHPPFLKIMDDIQDSLRYLFQTESKYTMLVSGSGHAGMEATIGNLVEPGEKVIVINKGIWGSRVVDLVTRYNGEVIEIYAEAGEAPTAEEVIAKIKEHKPAVVFTCQGESSTGVHQNLAGIGQACRDVGGLFLVDTVCSLGGVPLYADEWKIDAIYSGSQKVLSGPPGAAPLMLSERAFDKVNNRKTKPATFNLDLTQIGDYWGWYDKRYYHHTAPVSTFYAMREGLQVVCHEGLEATWKRHEDMNKMLWEGLSEMGLEPFPEKPENRLATVNTIKIPDGVDAMALIQNAMNKYSVEIAGGLGPSAGKCWRVGVMGYNAQPQNIQLVLDCFRDGLKQQGKL